MTENKLDVLFAHSFAVSQSRKMRINNVCVFFFCCVIGVCSFNKIFITGHAFTRFWRERINVCVYSVIHVSSWQQAIKARTLLNPNKKYDKNTQTLISGSFCMPLFPEAKAPLEYNAFVRATDPAYNAMQRAFLSN